MSEYEKVIGEKLRLKGKALEVKVNTKKKNHKKHHEESLNKYGWSDVVKESLAENNKDHGDETCSTYEERLTPAERRYLEQWKRIEAKRILKNSCESHRDRVRKFNEYLANLSEHYDIPKVGPG